MPPKKITTCRVNNHECTYKDGAQIRRGLCSLHYRRWLRTGKTTKPLGRSASLAKTGKLRCSKCKKNLPSSYFGTRKDSGAPTSWCKDCHADHVNMRRREDSAPEDAEAIWARGLSKYGLTAAQYKEMLRQQDGRCAICRNYEVRKTARGNTCRLHVDHDHFTGEVRGLLCFRCNFGIGYFKDDPDLLHAAIKYLEGGKPKMKKPKRIKRFEMERLGRESG